MFSSHSLSDSRIDTVLQSTKFLRREESSPPQVLPERLAIVMLTAHNQVVNLHSSDQADFLPKTDGSPDRKCTGSQHIILPGQTPTMFG